MHGIQLADHRLRGVLQVVDHHVQKNFVLSDGFVQHLDGLAQVNDLLFSLILRSLHRGGFLTKVVGLDTKLIEIKPVVRNVFELVWGPPVRKLSL